MDITTNKSKKQYMLEEQEIDIGQSESQFKTSLFGVLFVLLKDQGISIYTSCLLAIIQCIHLAYFAFHDLVNFWYYSWDLLGGLDRFNVGIRRCDRCTWGYFRLLYLCVLHEERSLECLLGRALYFLGHYCFHLAYNGICQLCLFKKKSIIFVAYLDPQELFVDFHNNPVPSFQSLFRVDPWLHQKLHRNICPYIFQWSPMLDWWAYHPCLLRCHRISPVFITGSCRLSHLLWI